MRPIVPRLLLKSKSAVVSSRKLRRPEERRKRSYSESRLRMPRRKQLRPRRDSRIKLSSRRK